MFGMSPQWQDILARLGAAATDANAASQGREGNAVALLNEMRRRKQLADAAAKYNTDFSQALQPQRPTITPTTSFQDLNKPPQTPSVQSLVPLIMRAPEGVDQNTLLSAAKAVQPAVQPIEKLGPGDILTQGGKTLASNPKPPEPTDAYEPVQNPFGPNFPGLWQRNKRTGELKLTAGPEKGTPADQDARNLGLQPGTPEYNAYVRDRTLPKPATTTINMPPQQRAFDELVGKVQGERYKNYVDAADAARSKLGMLGVLGPALTDAPFAGPAADLLTSGAMLMKQFGIEATDTSSAELARSLSNQMALMLRNPAGGAGMPGSMSNQDRQYLAQSVPGLKNSRGGAQKMVEIASKLEQRKIETADLAQQYVEQNGKLDSGFDKVLKQWAEAHPMFGVGPSASNGWTVQKVP